MSETEDFDPFDQSGSLEIPSPANTQLSEEARQIQARSEAFRDLSDRFYMLWWNLPGMTLRQVDRDIQDMFRMYMDLAPSMGVSRNGIQELRECCGRKRAWPDGLSIEEERLPREKDPVLGWCPGDIVRRITRLLGVPYCAKCDQRRRAINAFFGCGGA